MIGTRSRPLKEDNWGPYAWTSDDIIFNPGNTTGLSKWHVPKSGGVGNNTNDHSSIIYGLGDPCRLVGLTIGEMAGPSPNNETSSSEGAWQLPSSGSTSFASWVAEGTSGSSKGNSLNDYYPGRMVTTNREPKFEPAVGGRNWETGHINGVKEFGGGWFRNGRRYFFRYSSNQTDTNHNANGDQQATAYAIRCIPR